MKRTCESCIYWISWKEIWGEEEPNNGMCRKYAPVAVQGGQRNQAHAEEPNALDSVYWPATGPNEFCGDGLFKTGNTSGGREEVVDFLGNRSCFMTPRE